MHRFLCATVGGSTILSFEYNADGIRTSKNASGVEHIYHLNGTQIIAEAWGNKLLVYLYDASGSPIGMQYRTTSYEEGVFDTYWFEKNLQGDIIAVYSDAGTLLTTFSYDAWGKIASMRYYNSGSSTAAVYNPFRYRGYYYDTETGFYYLNSRYYDPNTGRFINADGYVSTGQGLIGNNMYAYCLNNPVMCTDPDGNYCYSYLNAESMEQLRIMHQRGTYGTSAPDIDWLYTLFPKTIADDISNFDMNNTDEQKVLESNYFSAYKGVPVIRLKIGDQAFSFGWIFLGDKVDQRSDAINTVRHEYGHAIQYRKMGVFKYIFKVAIPSLINKYMSDNNTLPYEYYSYPWEAQADYYGEVNRTYLRPLLPSEYRPWWYWIFP